MGSEMVSSTLKKIIKNHPKLYILDYALKKTGDGLKHKNMSHKKGA